MKKIFMIIIISNILFAKNQETKDEIDLFRESVADYYYRFIDFSTSFLYKKSNYDYIKKHNKLKVYFDNSIDEDGKYKGSLSIRANLKLPKISKNLYLTVDKESSNINRDEKKSSLQTDKQSSRVGLKYYFLRDKDKTIYTKLGGRINLKGDKFYFKFGADKQGKLKDINTYLYFNEYYYIKDEKFKTQFGLDFRKNLSEKYILSELNDITIDDNSDTYLTNTLLLDQYLNKRSMLSYWTSVITLYDDHSLETDSVSFNIKYHYLLKKWIFVDVIPSVVKHLTDNKEIKKYLSVNFGFIF